MAQEVAHEILGNQAWRLPQKRHSVTAARWLRRAIGRRKGSKSQKLARALRTIYSAIDGHPA
jgi:hypothetical protein